MGVNAPIEGSNPSFSVAPGRALRSATLGPARRGGRAVECGGLEIRYPSLGGSRVQIPPPPLASPGEVSEWSKERDWKSRMCRKVHRGFKSRPRRSCAPGAPRLPPPPLLRAGEPWVPPRSCGQVAAELRVQVVQIWPRIDRLADRAAQRLLRRPAAAARVHRLA